MRLETGASTLTAVFFKSLAIFVFETKPNEAIHPANTTNVNADANINATRLLICSGLDFKLFI